MIYLTDGTVERIIGVDVSRSQHIVVNDRHKDDKAYSCITSAAHRATTGIAG
jgi:hypothetical protein